MSILTQSTQYSGNLENSYKAVTENVGCTVTQAMSTPEQPTSRGNSTQPEKGFDNPQAYTCLETKLILDALQECSKETRQEVAEKILEKVDEIEEADN
jgi:hypothetical protein